MNFSKEIQSEIDVLIKTGKGDIARQRLTAISKKKITRSEILAFSQMARRVDMSMLALTKLIPALRPGGELSIHATPAELSEYAICVSKIGAHEEALDLLKDVDPYAYPGVHIAKTFALIAHWNHAAAIPGLQEYLGAPGITTYERLVAEANLVMALIHERRFGVAEQYLPELLEATKQPAFRFLHGKITALKAQSAILQEDWATAESYLQAAESFLAEMGGIDLLLVEKWRAIASLLKSKGSPQSLRGLKEIKEKALSIEEWETIRQCDYFEAIQTKNEALFLHLYFGTPYHLFRARLARDFGVSGEVPETYAWAVGGSRSSNTFDTVTGEYAGKKLLKNGQLLHRLFLTLCSDFYRPFRVAPLHFRLYPREYFNPKSSPERVLFAVKSLRRLLSSKRVPIEIETKDVSFRLTAKKPVEVLVRLDSPIPKKKNSYIGLLASSFQERSFSIQDAAKVLQSSTRTANRVMKELLDEEAIEQSGKGRAIIYKIKKAA